MWLGASLLAFVEHGYKLISQESEVPFMSRSRSFAECLIPHYPCLLVQQAYDAGMKIRLAACEYSLGPEQMQINVLIQDNVLGHKASVLFQSYCSMIGQAMMNCTVVLCVLPMSYSL